MRFISSTELYIFIFAALTMSLIYYVAFDKNIGAISSAGGGLLTKIMGQTNAGVFQKPF